MPIDTSGKPDMTAIRFRGTFSETVRRDIIEFIQAATFAPATRNGVPEPGIFKLRIDGSTFVDERRR